MKHAASCAFRTSSAAGLLSVSTLAAYAGDVPGSMDHPLLKRFANMAINAYSKTAFDAALLAGPPDQPIDDVKAAKDLALEGGRSRALPVRPAATNRRCRPSETISLHCRTAGS